MADRMKNLNGYLANFKKQIQAFEIIYKESLHKIPSTAWSWGGGTVLSIYYFRHRMSFDLDIFVNDPQWFAYLSPKWYIDDTQNLSTDYEETANHIKLKTDSGIKIDILLSPNLMKAPVKNTLLKLNFEFYVDTVEEIICKKLRYRLKELKSRDIFDLASALIYDRDILKAIYQRQILTSDDIFELKQGIENMNLKTYRQEIEMMLSVNESALNVQKMISDACKRLKNHISDLKFDIPPKILNQLNWKAK
jgi:predicted nucleotidyltransferase component of viral defense system